MVGSGPGVDFDMFVYISHCGERVWGISAISMMAQTHLSKQFFYYSYISRIVCAILFAISECAETSSSILEMALARPRGSYMIGKVGMPSIDLGRVILKPPTTHKE